jgi:hypothetical protein
MRTNHWFSALLAGLTSLALMTAHPAGAEPADEPPAEGTRSEAFSSEIATDVPAVPQDDDESALRSMHSIPEEDDAATITSSPVEPLSAGTVAPNPFGALPALLADDGGSRRETAGARGSNTSTALRALTPAPSNTVTAPTPNQTTGPVTAPTPNRTTGVVTAPMPDQATHVVTADRSSVAVTTAAPDPPSSVTPVAPDLSAGLGLAVLRREILADALFNLYSPHTGMRTPSGGEQIWLGGWDKRESLPWDRIFLGYLDGGELLPTLTTAVAVAGAAVNDPTVTNVPGSSELRMYFTLLASEHFDESTKRNVVWTGRSTDNGATWHDFQEAVGQANGVNSCGAWSPSAIAENSQICVYFHGNSPCLGVYRSCFLPDGLTMARPTEQLSLPFGLVNVDVFRADDRYLLVGDTLGLASFTEIRALESVDGQTWQPLNNTEDGLVVRAEKGVVFTPHIASVSGSVLTLLFSTRASFDVSDGPNALHRWTIDTRPAH